MAKVQGVESKAVNAYGAENLPARFEVVVNGRNGTVARIGFNIRNLNGQKLYVSDMLDGSDASFVAGALTRANLEYQKSDRKTFGPNGADGYTVFQLSEHEIGRGNSSLPTQSPDYCKKVVAFVLARPRVA